MLDLIKLIIERLTITLNFESQAHLRPFGYLLRYCFQHGAFQPRGTANTQVTPIVNNDSGGPEVLMESMISCYSGENLANFSFWFLETLIFTSIKLFGALVELAGIKKGSRVALYGQVYLRGLSRNRECGSITGLANAALRSPPLFILGSRQDKVPINFTVILYNKGLGTQLSLADTV